MTNQGARQQSVRDVTGTMLDYNGDWHALFDLAGIPQGDFNGRLLAWINDYLGTSYAGLPQAMQAFAVDQGYINWSSMGTFDAAGEYAPINTVAPVVSGTPTVGQQLTTTDGTWDADPAVTGYTYQWYRAPSTAITGATNDTYTLVADDFEADIFCRVTATNDVGSTPADSNEVGPVDAPAASVVYIGENADGTDRTTYTFTAEPIGTAAAGRRVFVAAQTVDNDNATIVSASIGGVTATIHASATQVLASAVIFSAVVPTGTTADIVFTWSAEVFQALIGVWSAYDLIRSTPSDTATATGTTGPLSLNTDVEAGGILLAAASALSLTTVDWTGLTEDYQVVGSGGGSNGFGGASDDFADAETPQTVSVSFSGAGGSSGAAVSWR